MSLIFTLFSSNKTRLYARPNLRCYTLRGFVLERLCERWSSFGSIVLIFLRFWRCVGISIYMSPFALGLEEFECPVIDLYRSYGHTSGSSKTATPLRPREGLVSGSYRGKTHTHFKQAGAQNSTSQLCRICFRTHCGSLHLAWPYGVWPAQQALGAASL